MISKLITYPYKRRGHSKGVKFFSGIEPPAAERSNARMGPLQKEFDALAHALKQTISLLEEREERFWVPYLKRGLRQVEQQHLAGATFILGCFGGAETFSDLRLHAGEDDLAGRNANARLMHLRDAIFASASAIASRRHW